MDNVVCLESAENVPFFCVFGPLKENAGISLLNSVKEF